MATNTSQANSSPLLSLPAELRNRIYREVFDYDNPVAVTTITFPEPPLLSTCKHIRNEASQLFYADRIFGIDTTDHNLKTAFLFQQKSEQIYDDFDIDMKHETICRSVNPNWQNVLASFRYYHDTRDQGDEDEKDETNEWVWADVGTEMVAAIFDMVLGLRELPWSQVEPMVERYHKVLIRIDARWR